MLRIAVSSLPSRKSEFLKMPPKLTCPAPAKLNLFLHVVGRRPDGYHLLQTLFRLIDLHDTLNFSLREDGVVHRTNSVEGVAEDQDLCVRAARLLQSNTGTGLGVDITVEKRIPVGGGLGGGSSDAATTLIALNRLWSLGLSRAGQTESVPARGRAQAGRLPFVADPVPLHRPA